MQDDHLHHLDAIIQNRNGIPNPNLNPNPNPNHNPNPNANLNPNLDPDAQSPLQFQTSTIRLGSQFTTISGLVLIFTLFVIYIFQLLQQKLGS